MGAAGCQIGTLFACAKESIAHPNFKRKLIGAFSHDTTVSLQVDNEFPEYVLSVNRVFSISKR